MKKPCIAISAHCIRQPSIAFGSVRMSALNVAYSDAVRRNGGIPVIIPFTEDPSIIEETLSMCSGAIIPGGPDSVNPVLFGQDPHPLVGAIDDALDSMELAMFRYLWQHQLPVLGICRGHELMNVFAGGTLYQDMADLYRGKLILHRQEKNRTCPVHKVTVTKGSRLEAILGKSEIFTNSMHRQSLDVIGSGFTVCARTSDGIVEAIEHENGLWLGLQWHPEELIDTVPEMNGVFQTLIRLASERI